MRILSIGKILEQKDLTITSVTLNDFYMLDMQTLKNYDYFIIHGGDGSIRRVLKHIHTFKKLPTIILNPTGSFNVIAKMNRVPKIKTVLETLSKKQIPQTKTQNIYHLNEEIFLFSAGNMGDLQHILVSENLRFGMLKQGILKYILAILFLLPMHLIVTPFMLLSSRRFFIFTPISFIARFGSFYGKIKKDIRIDLQNEYNLIELDGDIVTIEASILEIGLISNVQIVYS
ncbi:MAG: hypothetical protein DRQ78_08890 [Epsilonproteobacteria bacterium]|nr:MAG: hypothetical protein DRQ78_08890 [Campylobacterota bacterium]